MTIRVWATTTFEGFHRWPEAPEAVGYLRSRHRHRFHVRAEVEVTHEGRAVEFHQLAHRLEAQVGTVMRECDTETWSCERWAMTLLARLDLVRCEVSEDGEHGATVER